MICRNLTSLHLRNFLKSEKGATAVEFALVAPLFLGLVLAALQLGIIYLTNLTLDQAAVNAARLIKTGQAQINNTSSDGLKRTICEQITLLPNCTSNLQISIRSFTRISAVLEKPAFDPNSFQPGGPNDFVIVSAGVTTPVLFTGYYLSSEANTDPELVTSLIVQNEDFNPAQATPSNP